MSKGFHKRLLIRGIGAMKKRIDESNIGFTLHREMLFEQDNVTDMISAAMNVSEAPQHLGYIAVDPSEIPVRS